MGFLCTFEDICSRTWQNLKSSNIRLSSTAVFNSLILSKAWAISFMRLIKLSAHVLDSMKRLATVVEAIF